MESAKASGFRLEKLYLEIIDETGNCFILYRAKLKFLCFKFHYSALIFNDNLGVTYEGASGKKISDPIVKEALIYYNSSLNIKGVWKRMADPLPPLSFIYNSGSELSWNCHHPKASTEIFYDDTFYKGHGYAETLTITMKPLRIPMDELRWGRFISDEFTVVWLKWKGNNPLNRIYCNGEEFNDATLNSDKIVFADGRYKLFFQDISTVRNGKVSDVLSSIPRLKVFFGKRLLNTLEVKYKARSILFSNSEIRAKGWSLYETVLWKK